MLEQDIRTRVGNAIRQFRLGAGLSPKDFGDDIGKNQYYVLELEDGTIDIDLLMLDKCAAVLGIEISEIFFAANRNQSINQSINQSTDDKGLRTQSKRNPAGMSKASAMRDNTPIVTLR